MRARVTLLPGDRGAKQLQEQYGDQLICVRYRYDEQRQRRFKTVELIVKEYDWRSSEQPQPSDRLMQIRVAVSEMEVRQRIKEAGGRWNPQLRVWELRHDQVVALGLESRIIKRRSL